MIKWKNIDFFNDGIPDLLGYKSQAIELILSDMATQYKRGLEDGKRLGRARGHWNIEHDDDYSGGGYVECSICNMRYSFGAYHEAEDFYFCPKCGASMGGDEE